MQPGDRIQKSAIGRAALAGRSQDLPSHLRTLLLMVYGDKTAAEYSEVASRLPAGRDGFQQLVELGMVEVVSSLGDMTGRPQTASSPPPPSAEPLSAPMSDVTAITATHTVDEASQQRLLYPEFVRAVADLGLRGVMLQMKVERAMSAKELLALREQVEAAVARSKGEPARQEFSNRVNFLLTQH